MPKKLLAVVLQNRRGFRRGRVLQMCGDDPLQEPGLVLDPSLEPPTAHSCRCVQVCGRSIWN